MSKSNKIIIICALLFLVLFLVLIYVKSTRVTRVEKIKIEEHSSLIMNYMYNIDDPRYSQVEKYVLYALDYSLYENKKNSLTLHEMKLLLDDIFDNDFTEDEFYQVGITPEMVNRDIHYVPEEEKYVINGLELTNSDIAEKPVYGYAINKIRKTSSNKYIVTYDKYEISNPYEILNFYEDKNLKDNSPVLTEEGESIEVEKENKITDTSDITAYLNGQANRYALNKYMTSELLTTKGKKIGRIEITYVVNNSKMIVDKIKTE